MRRSTQLAIFGCLTVLLLATAGLTAMFHEWGMAVIVFLLACIAALRAYTAWVYKSPGSYR